MGSLAQTGGPTWVAQPLERAFVQMVDSLQKREVELHAAEERYRSMVEAIPAVVYAVQPDALFSTTYISPYVQTLLGVSARDWESDRDAWSHYIHPEDRERVLAEWRRRVADRGPSACEYRMTAVDGRVLWVRDTRTPARDFEGNTLTTFRVLEACRRLYFTRNGLDVRAKHVYVTSHGSDSVFAFASGASNRCESTT